MRVISRPAVPTASTTAKLEAPAAEPVHRPRPPAKREELLPGEPVRVRAQLPLPPAAAAVRETVRRVLGEPPPELDVPLAKASPAALKRFQSALERLEAQPPGVRLVAARSAARNEWLVNGSSIDQVAGRLEIALDTGYVLVDKGPLASNPRDAQGFSDDEVARLKPLLTGLPPNLQNVAGLVYITRDARSEADTQLFDQLKAGAKGPWRLLVGAADRANMGAAFGTAYYGSREVRLYSELFAGSKLPGLDKMLAYTTVHEIGHHALRGNPELLSRWTAFYEATGRAEAPNGYAGGSLDEGFGVGLGMFAVAPDELKRTSPRTWEFFHREYGDTLAAYRGRGLEPKIISLVYGLQDAVTKQ